MHLYVFIRVIWAYDSDYTRTLWTVSQPVCTVTVCLVNVWHQQPNLINSLALATKTLIGKLTAPSCGEICLSIKIRRPRLMLCLIMLDQTCGACSVGLDMIIIRFDLFAQQTSFTRRSGSVLKRTYTITILVIGGEKGLQCKQV